MVTAQLVIAALTAVGIENYSEQHVANLLAKINVVADQSSRRLSTRMLGFSRWPRCYNRRNSVNYSLHFKDFARALLTVNFHKQLDPFLTEMFLTIREVLLSANTNSLVATLANVRTDQLASPQLQRQEGIDRLEPFVGFVILANAVQVGLQASDPKLWNNWYWWDIG
eukprot:CAMPEP_0170643876 /NCGR_PEP_ID=MMETSP0224-20130122/42150_1 /TAXON_ID=285029 /ORGANISM="Togula jolla, Strain CCCM 725" /LENGTH=167 /DNA_ID=CAMNT_0010974795 /DNA_START=62 /DNA_END=561 /DNA_ORIENTATION=+